MPAIRATNATSECVFESYCRGCQSWDNHIVFYKNYAKVGLVDYHSIGPSANAI